jgi:hypothetical protein
MVNKGGEMTAEWGLNKRKLAVEYERAEYITASRHSIELQLDHPWDNL